MSNMHIQTNRRSGESTAFGRYPTHLERRNPISDQAETWRARSLGSRGSNEQEASKNSYWIEHNRKNTRLGAEF